MCKLFKVSEPLFIYPCMSSSLGTVAVSQLGNELISISENKIVEKMVLLPKIDSTVFVAISLCHDETQ